MDKSRDLLLYVDDEEQALKYFRLTFSKDYEVLTATSADEAWPLMEAHGERLALVVSDQRMPGRSGVELLTAVKERFPRPVRMLTTAYSDLDSAIAAVNQGEIYAYVTKPWKLDEFKVVIKQALQLYHLASERDALVAEKLGVMQQQLLLEHHRGLAMAVAGLSGQVARPMAAGAAWLRDRHSVFAGAPAAANHNDLWSVMLEQSRQHMVMIAQIGQWLQRERGSAVTIDPIEVLAEASAAAGALVKDQTPGTPLPTEIDFLRAGWRLLVGLLPHTTAIDSIRLSSPGGGTLQVTRGDMGNSTVAVDEAGLSAYLALAHHGAVITVNDGILQVELAAAEADEDEDALVEQLAILEA